MFVDKVKVIVKAGDGGDGALSFRHEKFVDKGGPDGGDGGRGGSVIFVATNNQNTLAKYRHNKRLEAQSGQPGKKQKKHGKNGSDLIAWVPVGTAVVLDDLIVCDLISDGQKFVASEGGDGGFGNAHFVSSVRQAPKIAEKGQKVAQKEITLELKMIADVGLVGLPNAGKSTMLATISNAKPEIADYPFTTLKPNLGVVDVNNNNSLLFADIPGLIEGASQGRGLGDEFLRHIERTLVLVHLIDIYSEDIAKNYQTIQQELSAYKINLSKRPQIVALSKVEGVDQDIIIDQMKQLNAILPKRIKVIPFSSKNKHGLKELLSEVSIIADKEKKKLNKSSKDELPVIKFDDSDHWSIERNEHVFIVSGKKIEKFAAQTDFSNYHAIARLRDIMKKKGIMRELDRQGIVPNDNIKIGTNTLKY
jgi:GTPase